jgi:SMODS and SLOG-associating 2TM effector domain 3/SMODS and SLOG-associating 2TM effector domain 1
MTATLVLAPEDFPALHQSASHQSLRAQKSFLLWFKIRLAGIVLAAVGGAIGWTMGRINIGGAIAFLAFAAALAAELILATRRPERTWYEGRAAAESAKTLAWRYMMHGQSFETNDSNADTTFLAEVKGLLHDLEALPVHVLAPHQLQISAKMRDIRALPFEQRRAVYLSQRIQDQEDWYAKKAAWNAARGNAWLMASVALEFLGLISGAVKAFGSYNVDLLGIFAATAAAATAWLQAKQHENLATAYAVTSQELSAVASELQAVTDEATWAKFVSEAEAAISREHTLWRASRGITAQSRDT